jgi:hypothetical protein
LKYTKEDLDHFEMVKEFLHNAEINDVYIDGEYPFYIDDRYMDEDNGTVSKKVYREGIRTSQRMFPVSTNNDLGKHLFNKHTIKYWKTTKLMHTSLKNYILNNRDNILTKRQKQFINVVLKGSEEIFSKQLRYKYRNNIQRRLKKAFLGVGGDNVPLHLVDQYRTKMDLIDKFIKTSFDNDKFQGLLMKKLDTSYINSIVYKRISNNARNEILDLYFKKIEKLSIRTLNEVMDCIIKDKEHFDRLKLQ